MNTVIIVCLLTGFIHFAETLSLAIRLAGARTKQVATSISFVNTSFLGARMSNMLQAPLLGALVDSAIKGGTTYTLIDSFRFIIFAAFVGSLLGAALIPTAVGVFEKAMYVFEEKASLPKVLLEALKFKNIKKILAQVRFPRWRILKTVHWKKIPHMFIYLNVVLTSVYAIGVLAALAAGALLPDLRSTAAQLSGIVNGIATVLLVIMVDPTGAHIIDKIVKGERQVDDARTMVFYLVVGRLFGILILSQLIFWPAITYIMAVTQWVVTVFVF